MTIMDELKPYEERAEREWRRSYVEDLASGTIRLTQQGRSDYGKRFAKVGVNIDGIRTMAQFKAALAKSEWVIIEELRTMVAGHPELEHALTPIIGPKQIRMSLLAHRDGDQALGAKRRLQREAKYSAKRRSSI